MEYINNILIENIAVIIGVLLLILIIWNITLGVKLAKLKKRFNRFSRGANVTNLEQVIEKYTEEFADIKENINSNSEDINRILNTLKHYKGKVEIIRYNAFGEEGNDLSFSISLLDENKNGVVITSIYNRGESNIYAKPITGGTSTYKLTKEEIEVIKRD